MYTVKMEPGAKVGKTDICHTTLWRIQVQQTSHELVM